MCYDNNKKLLVYYVNLFKCLIYKFNYKKNLHKIFNFTKLLLPISSIIGFKKKTLKKSRLRFDYEVIL